MANERSKSVGITETAAENAACLLDEIKLYGVEASREKLVQALFWGVTGPQAAGMISAFIMDAKRSGREPTRDNLPDARAVPAGEAPSSDAPDE
jgi:hypothetical protein